MSDLVMGVECGGSDTTSGLSCNPTIGRMADRLIDDGGTVIISETSEFIGAEHLFAARAVDAHRQAAPSWTRCRAWKPWPSAAASTCATRSPRPTTSAAASPRSRRRRWARWPRPARARSMGVLSYGQAPARKGLHFMDAPSARGREPDGASPSAAASSSASAPASATRSATWWRRRSRCAATSTPAVDARQHRFRRQRGVRVRAPSIADLGDQLYERVAEVASGTLRHQRDAERARDGGQPLRDEACERATAPPRSLSRVSDAIIAGHRDRAHGAKATACPRKRSSPPSTSVSVGTIQKALGAARQLRA